MELSPFSRETKGDSLRLFRGKTYDHEGGSCIKRPFPFMDIWSYLYYRRPYLGTDVRPQTRRIWIRGRVTAKFANMLTDLGSERAS